MHSIQFVFTFAQNWQYIIEAVMVFLDTIININMASIGTGYVYNGSRACQEICFKYTIKLHVAKSRQFSRPFSSLLFYARLNAYTLYAF